MTSEHWYTDKEYSIAVAGWQKVFGYLLIAVIEYIDGRYITQLKTHGDIR